MIEQTKQDIIQSTLRSIIRRADEALVSLNKKPDIAIIIHKAADINAELDYLYDMIIEVEYEMGGDK